MKQMRESFLLMSFQWLWEFMASSEARQLLPLALIQDVAMNRQEAKVPQDATATDNSCKEIGMPGFDIRLSPHHSMAAAKGSTKNAEELSLTRLRRQSPHHSHQVPHS